MQIHLIKYSKAHEIIQEVFINCILIASRLNGIFINAKTLAHMVLERKKYGYEISSAISKRYFK